MGASVSSGGGKSKCSAKGGGSLRAETGASVTAALSMSIARMGSGRYVANV